MMAERYLILVGASPDLRTEAVGRLGVEHGLHRVFESAATLVLASVGLPVTAIDESGIVLGALLDQGHKKSAGPLSPDASHAIVASRGRHLIERYWGGYVALLAPARTSAVEVVRAPFGWLAAFVAQNGPVTAIASDLGLLTTVDLYRPRLAPEQLACHLLAADIRHEETALADLHEVRGGSRLTVSDTLRSEQLWSPWTFASEDQRLHDADEAHRRLRKTVQVCIAARTNAEDRHLLLLSGGLDSSIVAACLRQARRSFDALTLVTDNPSGDERDHARRVAQALGVRLWEERFRIEDVDISRSAAAGCPRPVARSFEQGMDASIVRAAERALAGSIVDGGGGDNVFCSLQSPAPVADCLLSHQGPHRAWEAARDVAQLAEASVLSVAWRGWQRARSRRPYRRTADLSFLAPMREATIAAALDHPWLDAPADMLPGSTVHASLLIPAQALIEDHDGLAPLASHSLLVSQPLVELCLRIPSWLWVERSSNRAAARHAFALTLPQETVWRRSKGTPDSYLVQLLDANRPLIRHLLRTGLLADLGLIDVSAVTQALDDPRPARGHAFARIMQLVDVEVWARSWPA